MNFAQRVINKIRKVLFNRFYRKKLEADYRARIKNSDFTIICNNCFGGVLYHALGMKFLSPTINLYFDAAEYVKFLKNLDHYLAADLEYVGPLEEGGVLAMLGGDIRLFAIHYKTFDELKEKWYERRERVNRDNLFVIGSYIDNCTDDIAREFCALPYEHKVFLSHKDIDGCDCLVSANIHGGGYSFPGVDIMKSAKMRWYDATFDFVEWLNTGNVEDGKRKQN